MTPKQALAFISRNHPCPHENADTRLGTGKIWAECYDCGATFLQENWDNVREDSRKFDEAVRILMATIEKGKP